MRKRFSDLERSLGIATFHVLFPLGKAKGFSDLERSLGIATVSIRITADELGLFQ